MLKLFTDNGSIKELDLQFTNLTPDDIMGLLVAHKSTSVFECSEDMLVQGCLLPDTLSVVSDAIFLNSNITEIENGFIANPFFSEHNVYQTFKGFYIIKDNKFVPVKFNQTELPAYINGSLGAIEGELVDKVWVQEYVTEHGSYIFKLVDTTELSIFADLNERCSLVTFFDTVDNLSKILKPNNLNIVLPCSSTVKLQLKVENREVN